ncbi:MAG: M20 family metallopeptidase [Bacillota bacterium]|jgi:succinyl-diaminopimelate desuccinylase|nr:M20 family metallopeptidase [Bacillota bacterium]
MNDKSGSLKPEDYARIRKTAASLQEEMSDFLSAFLRIESENPPGNRYRECCEFLGEKMESLGCAVDIHEIPEAELADLAEESRGYPRYVVIGRTGTRGPVLHFSGHYDVVPAGDHWTVDPYGGIVKDGKIYGRGASDMKSGVAAQIYALEVLQKAGYRLKGSYVSSGVPDEETGGTTGMGWLVGSGLLTSNNTDYCIITEPLDPDRYCLGHRGTLWFSLELEGIQSHGSMPSEGLNPIDAAKELLQRIDVQIRPGLEKESAYPVAPVSSRKSTLACTMIEAGSKVNTIPSTCKLSFDWRLIPEDSVQEAKESLLKICDDLVEEKKITRYSYRPIVEVDPNWVTEEQHLVQTLKACGKQMLGIDMQPVVSPGMHDQRFATREGGLQASIVYGPGRLTQAHKSDEHIAIQDFLDGVSVMAAVALELLGFEKETDPEANETG